MSADHEDILPPFSLQDALHAGLSAPDRCAFHRTPFYQAHGAAFESWLTTIHSGRSPSNLPLFDTGRLRLVHWNIEQGKAWDRLTSAIHSNPRLRDADLWTLNEVDVGTARSGNRHVIRDLADRLNLHWVFIPNYLELTKGLGDDRRAPGENSVGLHGIGLLSRWPLVDPESAQLPECFDYFGFPDEKRYGCRRVLWATVRHPRGNFRLATTHLEVRTGPRCRARQMAAALAALPDGPCWFAGDFNTHTFRRGGVIQAVQEFLRLQFTKPEEIDRQVLEAWEREPLFDHLVRGRFSFRPWNDSTPTAHQVLAGVEEMAILPAPVRSWVTRQLKLGERTLGMRLDWIAARGPWTPMTGAPAAWTAADVGPEGVAAADHAPIGIDAAWPDDA
jgi:endonuclease/exonuclease/phosphatase family metal-dependent hydrolase